MIRARACEIRRVERRGRNRLRVNGKSKLFVNSIKRTPTLGFEKHVVIW